MNAFRTLYLLRWSHYSGRIPDETKSVIAHVFLTGCATFAFGFGIWNLDNIFCDYLTNWKLFVGWPIAFLFEGQFHVSLVLPIDMTRVIRAFLVAYSNSKSSHVHLDVNLSYFSTGCRVLLPNGGNLMYVFPFCSSP
jgi:hypothetical protein